MTKVSHHIRKFLGLLKKIPSYKALLGLQLLGSVTSFIGLPLLIPVMNFISKGQASEKKDPILDSLSSILSKMGVELTLPILLTVVSVLVIGGILLNGMVLLWARFAQYNLFALETNKLMRNYMYVRWPWITRTNSGLMNHALYTETVASASAAFQSLLLVTIIIQVVGYVLISFYISWGMSLIGCAVLGVIMSTNLLASRQVKSASYRRNKEQKHFAELIQSIQQNRKFLKSSVLQSSMTSNVSAVVEKLVRFGKKISIWNQVQPLWIQMAIFLLFVLMIAKHKLLGVNIEELFILLLVIMRLLPLISGLSSAHASLSAEIPVSDSLELRMKELENNREKFGERKYVDMSEIVMDGVFFSYDQKRALLKGISLTIPPHSTIAIVGESGEGKSTILDLLLGLWIPDKGTIYYGGISHTELDYYSLRKRIAYVSQETTLFPGTLRENLTVSLPDSCSDENINEVCKLVYLDQLLDELPEGLNTVVGENGVMLSGGQRQRVALGRALLVNPDILILDEATSALDLASERIIQKAIRNLHGKLTTLMVTHRISSVREADCIYVIEKGRIIEAGTHDELVRMEGRFASLLSIQTHEVK